MKQNVPLTISSLLSIVLFTVHLAHDIVFGLDSMTRAGTFTFFAIMLVSLYGTVELAGRRSGSIIMLLVGILAAVMPLLHTVGGPRSAAHGFFWSGRCSRSAPAACSPSCWRPRHSGSPFAARRESGDCVASVDLYLRESYLSPVVGGRRMHLQGASRATSLQDLWVGLTFFHSAAARPHVPAAERRASCSP